MVRRLFLQPAMLAAGALSALLLFALLVVAISSTAKPAQAANQNLSIQIVYVTVRGYRSKIPCVIAQDGGSGSLSISCLRP